MDQPRQVNPGQVSAGQVSAGQVSAGQVSAGQVSAGQVSAGQVSTVKVRFFAGARAAAGTPETDAAVHHDDRVSDVLARLQQDRPALTRVVQACSFLLDGVSARADDPVSGATELDVLPPFSGG